MEFSLLEKITEKKRSAIIGWRRVLHQNPEVGLDLPFTRSFVATELEKMGLDRACRQMDGGIVVDIMGKNGGDSSAVALRVDMDALPLCENTSLPYASSTEGRMHACAHDAHTAIGLGVASLLQELCDQWEGRVRIIFQSGEEELKGARLMLEKNVLENPVVKAILGLHLDPKIPFLSVGLSPGQVNAYVDKFCLTIKGRSAHAASPHLARDPVLAASFLIQALQSIVSRDVRPSDAAVISIGRIEGGAVFNIIPDRVVLLGTVRSLRSETRNLIFSRMKEILAGFEDSFGVSIELSFDSGCPPVICDEDLTNACIEICKGILDNKAVLDIPYPRLGGDDFAFFTQRVPGVMIRLGCGKKSCSSPLHSPEFSFDEKVLGFGVKLFSYILVNLAGFSVSYIESKRQDSRRG